jgi:hypothetical protein
LFLLFELRLELQCNSKAKYRVLRCAQNDKQKQNHKQQQRQMQTTEADPYGMTNKRTGDSRSNVNAEKRLEHFNFVPAVSFISLLMRFEEG